MAATRRRRSGHTGRGRRWTGLVTAVVTVLVGVAPGAPVAGAPSAAGSRGAVGPDGSAAYVGDGGAADPGGAGGAAGPGGVLPAGRSWTVTLLTGDVVEVRSDAEGRVGVTGHPRHGPLRTVRQPGGELYVIPVSVTPLVPRVLDLELFNVTGLVRQGYDDVSTSGVPLIVQRRSGVDVTSALAASGDEQPLPSIGAVATEVAKADAGATGALFAELGQDSEPAAGSRAQPVGGITKVWLDGRVSTLGAGPSAAPASGPFGPSAGASARAAAAAADPAANLVQVGADRAWAAGFTGAGTTIAVLDTGIDDTHPDLAGKVGARRNFGPSPDDLDHHGHGTHVASIAAGTGAASDGRRSGVAPAAGLISGKVVDDAGRGQESDVIAGMEWAAPQADVVSMSLGFLRHSDGSDPASQALDALTEQHGTLFVTAAGNRGPESRTILSPGTAERALTVGAVDGHDTVAPFSSRGPLVGSFELKPEVVAPGVDIVAAQAVRNPPGDLYVAHSGTSMATPHVAGAAALVAQRHPDWTAGQLEEVLVGSSDPIGADGFDAGAGRIDVGDAIDATVRAERDVVDVAVAGTDPQPHSETLTWTNTGPTPRTLDLDAELANRRGEPVGGVTVEPRQLSLAAGATGTATLTVDAPALEPGLYSGTVTADPGDGPDPEDPDDPADDPDDPADDPDDVRTPVGVHVAPETAELTIRATAPPDVSGSVNGFAVVANLDDYGLYGEMVSFAGTITLQVPVGRYAVLGDLTSTDAGPRVVAQVGDPDVHVTGDTTVPFDGAAAIPFRPTVEGVETTPPMYSSARTVVLPEAGAGGFGVVTEIGTVPPSPPPRLTPMDADPQRFLASQTFRLQAPPSAGAGSPDVYDIVTPEAGTVDPEPVLDEAAQEQLATLHERFHRDPDGHGSASDARTPILPSGSGIELGLQGPLAERRTAHVSPGVTWRSSVIGLGTVSGGASEAPTKLMTDAGRSYESGSSTTLRWLSRPLWPGPVGAPRSELRCHPGPSTRSAHVITIGLTPFQDGPDRFGCGGALETSMRLERDGVPVGTSPSPLGRFEVPAEPGTYRLTYEQIAALPYAHRSTTAWTFRSAAPETDEGDEGDEDMPLPLLVVDQELPLDTLNRPTGRNATFAVHHVTGANPRPIDRLRVWTSIDDGTSWQQARVRRRQDGTYRVTLPTVAAGTGVSLRADARDVAGNRIEQTLIDAYVG